MNKAAIIGFMFVLGVTAAAFSAVYWHHRQRREVRGLPATVDAPVLLLNDSVAVLFEQLNQLLDYLDIQVLRSRQTFGSHLNRNPPMPTVEVSVELTVDSDSEQLPERDILQVMTSSFDLSTPIPEPQSAVIKLFPNPTRHSRNLESDSAFQQSRGHGVGRLCGAGGYA